MEDESELYKIMNDIDNKHDILRDIFYNSQI